MSVLATSLDNAVSARGVDAVTPLTVELALAALTTWKSAMRQSRVAISLLTALLL
ncbi:hypothetical protein NKH19_31215 [Mesorhizobium sp. M1338]|uniref:hypothetical protein n=1 Tax=Mesorhizobium sp. M1338 TaxID=2957085 RepID=UPI0033360492